MTPPEYLKWITDNIAIISTITALIILAITIYYLKKDKPEQKSDWEIKDPNKKDLETLTHQIADDITIDVEESYNRAQNFESQCTQKIEHLNKKEVTVKNLLALLENKLTQIQTAKQLEQARIEMIQEARNKRTQVQR